MRVTLWMLADWTISRRVKEEEEDGRHNKGTALKRGAKISTMESTNVMGVRRQTNSYQVKL